ncbi:MAG TPA: quinol:electron acceptor oxidoreductase subunit ActD [Bacteroidota bacterium]|nr:quinol:electron acceptor oxidoreductase subunit ActD [Bacteroidota bacterium]
MDKKILYSITALFDTPDGIIHAAEEVRRAGYKKYDVHTPYPMHGMNDAMDLKDSKLGFITLAAGLLGGAGIFGFVTWVFVKDYPNVIGGKPYFSWPAFVPITFEITVLSAVLVTVGALIAFFFKFPNNSHPLHDTLYMKSVSSDKFGISIQADDPMFDEEKATALLQTLHAQSVQPVYYDEEELTRSWSTFDPKFLLLLAGVAIIVSGATYVTMNILLYLPPFDWMSNQNKFKPQSTTEQYSDLRMMRPSVEGTVARGFMPYPYHGNPDAAGKNLVNPLPASKGVIEIGRTKFLTFCSPCHGNFARGDSRLRGQFPNPPTLHSDKVRNWPDGNIYHVITEGQNIMPSYASQITRDERWAIVHYVRTLQRAFNAKESDQQ